MKQIKYLLFILSISVALVFSGCESDPNGRMPDDIMDANIGVITVTESDPFINVSTPGDYSISMDVDLLFEGDFQKLEVVVVFSGDYENQNVLEVLTSVPASLTFTTSDLVDAIEAIAAPADIVEGDVFHVFTNITLTDGTYLPSYDADGNTNLAPSVNNITVVLKGAQTSVNIPVPCEFVLDHYLGPKAINNPWWPGIVSGNVIEDPDYTGDKLGLIIQGMGSLISNNVPNLAEVKIIIDLYDYSIVGNPDSQVIGTLASWNPAYANPTFSQISGSVETCDQVLAVNVGSLCVSLGCFGGMPIAYTVYDAAASQFGPVEGGPMFPTVE